MTVDTAVLSVIYAECCKLTHFVEWKYAQCHYAEGHVTATTFGCCATTLIPNYN
jgi:hypothetical protein